MLISLKLGALLTLLSFFSLVFCEDYYKILGVNRDATEKEIKKAYRALSRQFHPDKNRGNSEEASKKFAEIANAYEILSDKESRQKYDRHGEAAFNGQRQHHDPMDIFAQFFGGGFGGHGGNNGRRRGPNAQTTVAVTLIDAYVGSTLEFSANMQGICYECDGSGSADGQRVTCGKCHGSGQVIVQHQLAPGFVQRLQTTCDKCGGQGSVIKTPCPICHGARVIREDRKYNIFLPEGAPREWDYTIEGEAEQSPDYDAGDLIIHITEAPTDNLGYRRRGHDLFRNEVLSSSQASKGGWQRSIRRLDNHSEFKISRPNDKPVFDGDVEIIHGEGMPIGEDQHGDLYIKYIVIPSSQSKDFAHSEL